MAGNRPGPRPKGVRSSLTVRVPQDQRHVFEEAARKEGLPLSDYIALLLARAHGLEDPEYIRDRRNQAELPVGA